MRHVHVFLRGPWISTLQTSRVFRKELRAQHMKRHERPFRPPNDVPGKCCPWINRNRHVTIVFWPREFEDEL